ncbi:hypothetical protein A2856_01390 [Candidatus Uhrbacteria bacterium RIFCSPHIGHO2_01_FULL_63_20]|uniref:Uncharacterized protein n=1 Tax=Candidatus Uhrbacteria bacterium RIFCSPHIGHO2_01_FULL_63_20 TaxID=1802385 RepID=A0A1F7TJZ7_9BACT|nr:MAG: hypothetical protein A2856_01390 [Candidatus Uhrbacteria bacterium RIFCSPHIGHO2_01_FULL_63_20]
MTHSLRIGKRALTLAVAGATILWSVGVSAFVAPLTARAAVAGDRIKGTTLSTVYYLASDGARYAFPNEKTYMTWFSDFSGVQTMSDSALAAIPLAGNVVYRPGSNWIKIQSDPKTYAVTPQGQIRWIETEAVAVGLAGANWNQFINDVADVFFVDYSVGASLTSAGSAYNGALVSSGGNNYLIWNGQKRMVTSAGFSANRYQSRFLLSGSGINLAGITAGADVSGAEAALGDAAQLGGGVTGGLSVSLASDTPASVTVPEGAASVPFTKFKLTANAGSVTINQIVVTLGGVGVVGNIDEVYLYKGDARLTDGRSVNSSTRQATFTGLGLSMAAGESLYLTVRADMTAAVTGGDTASFGINASSDVSGTATVSGAFPVMGNAMSLSGTPAGTVEVDKNGTVSNPTIGEDGAVIGKFTIAAEDEDASIKQITLNVDSASDHTNYKLWKGSTLLGNGSVSGDLVTFVLTNPLLVEDGDNENLELSADIGGEAGDTISVGIEEEADVTAIGGDFNFNLSVDIGNGNALPADGDGYDITGSLCDATGDDCSFSEVEGGQLTFAFNGPASDDIQVDGSDQVLMKFSITAEELAEIQEFDVIVECVSGAAADCDADNTDDAGDDDGEDDVDDGGLLNEDDGANLQDITVRLASGAAWMGPEELSGVGADDTQTLTFDDNQSINAGQTLDLMITADLENEDGIEGEAFSVTIDMSTVVAEDGNGDALAAGDIVPSADLAGNEFTATDASLDIEVSQPPSSGTFVKGTSGVSVVGFNFSAGDASDVTVTDLTLNVDGDTDGATAVTDNLDSEDFISSCSLYDSESGALVDGPESIEAATEEILFENFDWTVAAGETAKLITKCNLANVDTDGGAGDDDIYEFRIDAAGDVEAEDEDGDTVDPTLVDGNGGGDTEITVIDAGDITVTLDGGTANSTIVLGSSTGVAMSKFKFDAEDESFLVKEITLRNCVIPTGTADADGDCADAGETVGADDIAAAVKISYLNQAGATVSKTGFLSGGYANFSGLEMYVPVDATRVLTVVVDTNTVSPTGATSGDQISLNFDAEDTGATATFEAVGVGSGETLTEADVDTYIAANEMTARKTKPTISLASGSPSGAGVQGLSEVLRFNVAADSRGSVTLDTVTFLVSTFDSAAAWADCDDAIFGAATGWEFYDIDDPSTKLDDATDWTFLDAAGNNCTAGEPLKVLELDLEGSGTNPAEEIGAGETKTYVLRADTTGAIADDSIRVDIADEASVDAYAFASAPDAISWDDETEALNINGSLIKNLPVTGGSIVY